MKINKWQKIKPFFTTFILILFLAQKNNSQIAGSYTYQALLLPYSAEQAALGGSQIADFSNFQLILDNPSILQKNFENKLNFNFTKYFAQIKWGNIFYAKDFKKFGTFGFAINYLNYGKFTQTDFEGNIIGEFKANDLIFNLLWAIDLDTSLRFGINIKPIYSHLETYTSFGIALDLGFTYFFNDTLTNIALTVKNFGSQLKTYVPQSKEPLPFDIQLGYSQKLRYAPFKFLITYDFLNKFVIDTLNKNNPSVSAFKKYSKDFLKHFIFGMQIIPSEKFYISLGFNYRRFQDMKINDVFYGAGISGGINIKLTKFTLTYSFSKYYVSSSAHNFSLILNLSKFKKIQK